MGLSPMRAALLLLLVALPANAAQTPAPVDVTDLADYRLSQDVFDRFVQASSQIGKITKHDPAFRYAPLFTKDVALSGDAPEMASGLIARLENHLGLTAALEAAKLTPREYARFAIALVGAHLADGFLKAGVLRRVPSGAPTINVEFIRAHEAEVAAVLEQLGIDN
jgi:hypothetical protein